MTSVAAVAAAVAAPPVAAAGVRRAAEENGAGRQRDTGEQQDHARGRAEQKGEEIHGGLPGGVAPILAAGRGESLTVRGPGSADFGEAAP